MVPPNLGGEAQLSVVPEGRTGQNVAVVESKVGADAGWQAQVRVRPFSKYRLTARIKTEGVQPVRNGLGALLNLHGRPEHTAAVTGTTDWTRVELDVETGADDVLLVNCLLGYYGTAKGRAYYDDVEMEMLETRQLKPSVTLDTAPRFDPISKYLYSQFIEQLGRCVYGGIWAEMLEDRKFFYAVGAPGSAWKADSGTVAMTTDSPLVGTHSPVLEKGNGLAQEGLWLQKGRGYVGRIWLRGTGSMRVSLGDAANTETRVFRSAGTVWSRFNLRFTGASTTKAGRLTIASEGGTLALGTVSLMPADNVKGMRRDTLQALRELNAPLYRWPGGNFASGYDWNDGIGDPDRRPPRKNPAWQGIEHNDFGTHELLECCRALGTAPRVVGNTGLGTPEAAAAWLQYVNGPADSPQGRRRAANGRAAPWKVEWWGIGNEMYGSWQIGHMPLDAYVAKHKRVVEAMRAVDPAIRTIAVGDVGEWSRRMLSDCAGHMSLISEHFYCQERPGVMGHAALVRNAIRAKVEAHRRYRDSLPDLKGRDIRIAMDEWNYWYGPHVFGELGTRYFMKDALGIAAGLHEFYRSTDMVFMAQYAQTVNVIGAIKTTPTAAAFETTGLVLKLYRQRFGTRPVAVTGDIEPLDVAAALTEDRKTLTLGVVNPTADSVVLPIARAGLAIADDGTLWEIAHPDPLAHNNPGEPDTVKIVERKVRGLQKGLTLAPQSVTLVRVAVAKG